MIIVLQSIPEILVELKRLAQSKIDADRLAKVVFTSSHREALDYVRQGMEHSDRTIVLSSTIFYAEYPGDEATNALTASILATGVKAIDPTSWFFVYSTMPQSSPSIDGVIPKESPDMYAHALEFIASDFVHSDDLDALRKKLPWLK